MRKTKEQKAKMMSYAHAITCARYEEFTALGVGEFANWCHTPEFAVEVKNLGITVEQWIEWRKVDWDLQKYPTKTPKLVAGYIARGMTPTEAKRELSRTYPSPMRTR